MFERQVLGEDYWKKQAATQPVLFPSNAPLSDALVRGEVVIAPLLYNTIYPKKKDGAPIEIFFAPEGAPVDAVRGRRDQDRRQSQCRPSCSSTGASRRRARSS